MGYEHRYWLRLNRALELLLGFAPQTLLDWLAKIFFGVGAR